MKTIKIQAQFPTVLDALNASGIDISYNPGAAKSKAADISRPNRHFKQIGNAMLAETGDIYFTVKCFDGLVIVNKFDPFISCLDDSDFTLANVTDTEITIYPKLQFPKKQRAALAKIGAVVI